MFSLLGFLVSLMSVGFFALIIYRRLAYGPEAEGLFTLFAIAFLLIGVALFGIGLLGEYVGRIYQQVRERPRYLIQAILEARADSGPEETERTSRRRPLPYFAALALMRAVVFAYHNVGVRCLSVLLAHGIDVRAGGHASTTIRPRTSGSTASRRWRGLHGLPVITPDDPNDPAIRRARSRRSSRISCSRSTTGSMLSHRAARDSARAARSTCTARCCRVTAAACRSTGR